MLTLQELVPRIVSFGERPSLGLRQDLGLRWWSYAELGQRSYQAAAILRQEGIGKEDHVLLRAPNCPEWVAFFLGTVLLGAVLVPVDSDASPDFVRRAAARTSAKLFVYSGEPLALEGLRSLDLGCLYREPLPGPADNLTNPVLQTDPAIVFFTSGTTASPRCIVLSHGNIVSQVEGFRGWRRLARWIPVRMAVMAPLSHSQGIMLGMAIPLSLGLSVIYTQASHPAYLVRLLRDNRVVVLSTVPRVLRVLSDFFRQQPYGKGPATLADKLANAKAFPLRRHYIFTHLRRLVGYHFWMIFVGGAPLPREEERFWFESGCLLVQGYGLTETSAIVSVNAPVFGAFGSVGKALANQKIRLAEDGEILVRGANVMSGYANEDNTENFSDGFLRTGDIGRFDQLNRLYIVGRKKDVVVTGEGFNVYPSDVEGVLNALPGVQDSVVLGVEDEGHTRVHAVLLLRPGTDASELISQANERLLLHQQIQSWTVWSEPDFPRTSLLKPRRTLIRERLLRGSQNLIDAPDKANDLPQILSTEEKHQRLSALARYLVDVRSATQEEDRISLARDLGISSLDMAQLLLLLERESGHCLHEVMPNERTTVAELRSAVLKPTLHDRFNRHEAVRPPWWADLFALRVLRRWMNPLVLRPWAYSCAHINVAGTEHLPCSRGPVIYAGGGHQHGSDGLFVYYSLPAHLRTDMALIMSRWVFRAYLRPDRETHLRDCVLAFLGLKLLVPLFFPVVLSSSFEYSHETLLEACRLIDRGFSVLAFEGRGVALMAKQSGVPVVPVALRGNNRTTSVPLPPRATVSVTFGAPLLTDPSVPEAKLIESLDQFFSTASQENAAERAARR
jgi:long-chain acyl-CoA synthetase